MATNTIELKILDMPEVKEVLEKADDRIQELESAMQRFVDDSNVSTVNNLFMKEFIIRKSDEFEQLLNEKAAITEEKYCANFNRCAPECKDCFGSKINLDCYCEAKY